MERRTKVISLVAGSVAVLAAALIAAGPLNPPAGPVSSAYKTLTEVEPRVAISLVNTPGDATSAYKITQSGSYYLTGNVSVRAGVNGVIITATNVTIDLCGFTISGASGSLDGITATVSGGFTTLKNGNIYNMGGRGIDLSGVPRAVISDLTAYSCGTDGIYLAQDAHVHHCSSSSNGGFGISAGYGSLVESCTAQNNTGIGISAGNNATITGCVSASNGSHGIRVTFGCVATRNNCGSNGTSGTGAGIDISFSANRVEDNQVTGNSIGIKAEGASNVIFRNVSRSNTVAWSFVANNVYGQIVDRSAPGSPLINGSTAASSSGTTDPNANITY